MAKRLRHIAVLTVSLFLFFPCLSRAGIVDVNSVRVTDVTSVQFAVVWGTTEPATGTIKVFANADGTIPVTKAVLNFESVEHPPAEDIGVLKVRVSNLESNKSYYFQIESTTKAGGTVSLYPEVPPFMSVMTEQGSTLVRNDVLAQQISIDSGKSTKGTLVIATVEQAAHPVTGWAGEGVPEGWVAIDTNNFYDKVTHANLELAGGEPITLTYFCGSMGSVVTEDTVPAESGVIQAVKVAANLPDPDPGDEPPGDNPEPPAAPSPISQSSGGGGGGSCFIATVSDVFFGF